jgi:hypothetical protein
MLSGNLVYNNKMWFFGGGSDCVYEGGAKGDVWTSADGSTWTEPTANAAFGRRWAMGTVVFNNKMWVIGGLTASGCASDVWTSIDGATWTQVTAAAPFAPRESFGCVVYNNKIWVIGGDNTGGVGVAGDTGCSLGDVWSSPDGINWTLAGNFPDPRTGAACVVFNGAIWVIGGGNSYPDPSAGTGEYSVFTMNDTWSSTDGVNWTQQTENAAFSGRVYPMVQVFNNQIWMLGGAGASYFPLVPATGVDDDVWVSGDGINWTQTYPTLPFAARFGGESFVFKNSFWALGGCEFVPGGAAYYSDVWHNP